MIEKPSSMYLSNDRLDTIRQSPRQANVSDIEDLCAEIDRLRSAQGTPALPHASAALTEFMAQLGEIMSMQYGATPADYLQRARDIREWCHDHRTALGVTDFAARSRNYSPFHAMEKRLEAAVRPTRESAVTNKTGSLISSNERLQHWIERHRESPLPAICEVIDILSASEVLANHTGWPCVHPARQLLFHGGITGNLSHYRCNLCQAVLSLPWRKQAAQETSENNTHE